MPCLHSLLDANGRISMTTCSHPPAARQPPTTPPPPAAPSCVTCCSARLRHSGCSCRCAVGCSCTACQLHSLDYMSATQPLITCRCPLCCFVKHASRTECSPTWALAWRVAAARAIAPSCGWGSSSCTAGVRAAPRVAAARGGGARGGCLVPADSEPQCAGAVTRVGGWRLCCWPSGGGVT